VDDRHAWERPGAYEVAPGVHRIPLPLPGDHLKAVNVYAIDAGDQVVLIDGGWTTPKSIDALEQGLAMIERQLRDVREFLVTHVHRDHYTQALAVRRLTGSRVALGAAEQVNLELTRTAPTGTVSADLRRAGAAGLASALPPWPPPDPADWEDPDWWLTDGLDVAAGARRLRVIATPGHTRGHVVFHDRSAHVLFGGDHELAPSVSPLADYLASLRLMLRLPDAALLPAHGPVTTSTHARVEELLAHHEQRLTATATAVDRGASCGFEVATGMTWTRHERRLDELDLFAQSMAIHETVAHLRVLVERGWLRAAVVDGVERFTRA
jgi:glyoxylase-like metal-dependent hydrolase (beta-lactamase superfamily II)